MCVRVTLNGVNEMTYWICGRTITLDVSDSEAGVAYARVVFERLSQVHAPKRESCDNIAFLSEALRMR
jgi:hypothetical protein